MKTIIKYLGRKTHNVKTQLLYATVFGLLELYGFRGAIAIILKARKFATSQPRKTVTQLHRTK